METIYNHSEQIQTVVEAYKRSYNSSIFRVIIVTFLMALLAYFFIIKMPHFSFPGEDASQRTYYEKKEKKSKLIVLVLLILIVLITSGLAYYYYSQKIAIIEQDLSKESFVEYEGLILYESGTDTLVLVDAATSFTLHNHTAHRDGIENNFTGIPDGYSYGYLVYLQESKAVVYYAPQEQP